ncbi:hypothetical protein N9Z93_04825, partial [Akkermansiaceae bacterium]|nr:hypothetical protein [Akkermansiaceae bacterium]
LPPHHLKLTHPTGEEFAEVLCNTVRDFCDCIATLSTMGATWGVFVNHWLTGLFAMPCGLNKATDFNFVNH